MLASTELKLRAYLEKLCHLSLSVFLHVMKDLLNEITKVSLQFQREDVHLSSVVTKLQTANESLHHLSDNDDDSLHDFWVKVENGSKYQGQNLQNVVNNDNVLAEKRRLVQSVTDCIHRRLENIDSEAIFLSCHAFDKKNWPVDNRQARLQYGNNDLDVVCNHFQKPLVNAGYDIDKAKDEWKDLKFYVSRNDHFRGQNPLSIWQIISQEDLDRSDYILC